jgi:hypothetical protein
MLRFLLSLILVLSMFQVAHTQTAQLSTSADVAYLRGMPTPEKVLKEIKGNRNIDTYARQVGAFYQLNNIIKIMVDGQSRSYTTVEKDLVHQYTTAASRIDEEVAKFARGDKQTIEEYRRLVRLKYGDYAQAPDLLTKIVSSSTMAGYRQMNARYWNNAMRGMQNRIQSQPKRSEIERWIDVLGMKTIVVIAASFFLPWTALAILLGWWGRKKGNSFWTAFLISFLCSPLIGLIVVASSRRRDKDLELHDIIPIPIQPQQETRLYSDYLLYSFSGEVVGSGKRGDTTVSGGYQSGITSTTVVHDQLRLKDRNGKQRDFQLQDFDVACWEGDTLTILWAIQKGSNQGPYIAVHNHASSKTFYHGGALKQVFGYSPIFKAVIILGLIGGILGLMVSLLAKSVPPVVYGTIGGVSIGAFFGAIIRSPDKKAIGRFKSVLSASLERASIG